MRWPNGGGVAHEIFKVEDTQAILWRMSLAEVGADCLFSRFGGMTRCTTVVSGAGMDLTSTAGTIPLRPLQPVTFSGELPLTGVLVDGPVENLNVVYDAERINLDVRVQVGISEVKAGDVVFVQDGDVVVDG